MPKESIEHFYENKIYVENGNKYDVYCAECLRFIKTIDKGDAIFEKE